MHESQDRLLPFRRRVEAAVSLLSHVVDLATPACITALAAFGAAT